MRYKSKYSLNKPGNGNRNMVKPMSADEKLYLVSESKKILIEKFIDLIKNNSIEKHSSNLIIDLKQDIDSKINAGHQYKLLIEKMKDKIEN